MVGQKTVYSIQRTYTLKTILTQEKVAFTCDERIDIPTIEPLTTVDPVGNHEQPLTVVPCIEIRSDFLTGINLTFETNEGITVLPVEIQSGTREPLENPYITSRYVLVLPRGSTGVKSCKITLKDNGEEIQHNFTFGIMPPAYNYDNALFGYLSDWAAVNTENIRALDDKVNSLKLTTKTPTFASIELPKGAGKQTINIENGVLFYDTVFNYPSSLNPTSHNPKITLHSRDGDFDYTLSLNRDTNTVSIDLLTGMITEYDGATGEIMHQFKIAIIDNGFETLSFDNFDDIIIPYLPVLARGARVI